MANRMATVAKVMYEPCVITMVAPASLEITARITLSAATAAAA